MRWYEGIWWVVLFACFLLYIAKHPENFARYYVNKRGNLIPFIISIFYGNGISAIPYQQAFFYSVFSFYLSCYCCLSQIYCGRAVKRGSLTEETHLVFRIVMSAIKCYFITSKRMFGATCVVGAFEVG